MSSPRANPPGGDAATVVIYATDATGATVQLAGRARAHYPRRFLTMFPATAQIVAAFDRPPAYHRTLLWCLGVLDPIQPRGISAADVAAGARISKASAERALAMLEADRVILASGKTAAKRRRLNNRVAWAAGAERFNETEPDPEPEDARGR